jgi:predicted esterase
VGIAGPYSAFDQLADSVPDLGRVVGVGAHLGQNPGLLVRLIHGRHDATVPFSVSEDFADALAAAGYDATLTPVDEGHKVPWDETLAAISQLVNSLDSRASD